VTPSTDFTRGRLRGLLGATHPLVVWRHDVDYDPACALQMAELEREHGVRATYYLMPRAEDYNVFAPSVRDIIRGILACGHQLGVHVNLELPREATVPTWYLAATCYADYKLVATNYEGIQRKVSLHAPPQDARWRDIPSFDHAMSAYWEHRYLGDSRGVWHEPPEELLARGDAVQLNLHPEWWFWPEAKADEWRRLEAGKP
jgi:hypothetical protein